MISGYMRVDTRAMDMIETTLPRNVSEKARQAAEAVVADINASWYPTSPSPRGGPPAVKTGELRDSVRLQARDQSGRFSRPGSGDVIGYSIVYHAKHAGILESAYLDRHFLGPALERMAPNLGTIFSGVITTSYRP